METLTAPSPNEIPSDGIIRLDFDAEVVTYQVLQNPDKATFLEKNAAQARASRSKVSVNIYSDGTAEWRMEKLIPKYDVRIAHKTPANTMPQTKVSRVDRSGMGFFFDENGRLLHQDEVKMMSLIDLYLTYNSPLRVFYFKRLNFPTLEHFAILFQLNQTYHFG